MIRHWMNLLESISDPSWVNTFKAKRSTLQSRIIAVTHAIKTDPSEENQHTLDGLRQEADAMDAEYEAHYGEHMRTDSEITRGDYVGQHQAPCRGDGSPLWDLRVGDTYPKDFYQSMYQYLDDTSHDMGGTVSEFYHRPNASLKVYRAIPAGLPRKINPGDWVTIGKRYAVEHGRDHLNGEYVIVSKTVFARDLFTDGNSLAEWGYDPQPVYDGRFRTTRR